MFFLRVSDNSSADTLHAVFVVVSSVHIHNMHLCGVSCGSDTIIPSDFTGIQTHILLLTCYLRGDKTTDTLSPVTRRTGRYKQEK